MNCWQEYQREQRLHLDFFFVTSPKYDQWCHNPPSALTLKEDHGCVSILSDDALPATGPVSLASHTLPLMWFLNRFLDHFAGLHFFNNWTAHLGHLALVKTWAFLHFWRWLRHDWRQGVACIRPRSHGQTASFLSWSNRSKRWTTLTSGNDHRSSSPQPPTTLSLFHFIVKIKRPTLSRCSLQHYPRVIDWRILIIWSSQLLILWKACHKPKQSASLDSSGPWNQPGHWGK